MQPIPRRVHEALSRGIIDGQPFTVGDVNRLLDPAADLIEDGAVRNPDGSATACCRTEFPQCSVDMVFWWLQWHLHADRYRLWHPRAHVRSLPAQSSDAPYGSVCNVDEFFGEQLYKLFIHIMMPKDFGLDDARFPETQHIDR